VDRPVSAEEQKMFESENAAIAMKQAQNMMAAANEVGQEEEDDEDSDASSDEYTAADAEEDEASSEDSDEDDEEEEEEMDEEMVQKSTVLYQVMENLAVQLERAPTMDEIKQALRDIAEAQANGNLGEDEEVASGEEAEEKDQPEAEPTEGVKNVSVVSETPAKDFSVEATAAAAAAALTSPDTVAFASPSALGKRKGDEVEASKDVTETSSETQQSSPKAARSEAVA